MSEGSCSTAGGSDQVGEIKREIMFEKDWNQPCIHIDVPVPYEEDYQIKMLRHNEIKGLLRVSGVGRAEESRYTYQTKGGVSLEKKYENQNIDKETILSFIRQFMDVVEDLRSHMLDPDCLLTGPEYIYEKDGRFGFCYLPVPQKSLYRSFHEMTEFFVRKLDYKDTEGIFLSYLLHRSTLREDYDLREIMEEYERGERERSAEKRMERTDSEEEQNGSMEGAIFVLEDETEEEPYTESENRKYKMRVNESAVNEEKKRYGPIGKVISRIKTGRWGNWQDLITEIDGQDETGHL